MSAPQLSCELLTTARLPLVPTARTLNWSQPRSLKLKTVRKVPRRVAVRVRVAWCFEVTTTRTRSPARKLVPRTVNGFRSLTRTDGRAPVVEPAVAAPAASAAKESAITPIPRIASSYPRSPKRLLRRPQIQPLICEEKLLPCPALHGKESVERFLLGL